MKSISRHTVRDCILDLKSLVRRALQIPDPCLIFRRFERDVHPDTWKRQRKILAECSQQSSVSQPRVGGDDPHSRLLASYKDTLKNQHAHWRILIHLPKFAVSPAGHSLFRNLAAGLDWNGIAVDLWHDGTPLAPHLAKLKPTAILSIDHVWYHLNQEPSNCDIEAFSVYRSQTGAVLGLASNHGSREPEIVARTLDLARALDVNFFYSFQCPQYVAENYSHFFSAGFPVLSLEFGANPMVYRPIAKTERDINFVFLGSSNAEKWERYVAYLSRPISKHAGLIIGPGWSRAATGNVSDEIANQLYNRARIGLNLHVPFQIQSISELNERAYNLASAGTPQITDRPALLSSRFSEDEVFAASTPDEYFTLFEYMLRHPEEAAIRASKALTRVLSGHTVLHRADSLIQFLESRFSNQYRENATG